jgi:hypothetical protein
VADHQPSLVDDAREQLSARSTSIVAAAPASARKRGSLHSLPARREPDADAAADRRAVAEPEPGWLRRGLSRRPFRQWRRPNYQERRRPRKRCESPLSRAQATRRRKRTHCCASVPNSRGLTARVSCRGRLQGHSTAHRMADPVSFSRWFGRLALGPRLSRSGRFLSKAAPNSGHECEKQKRRKEHQMHCPLHQVSATGAERDGAHQERHGEHRHVLGLQAQN